MYALLGLSGCSTQSIHPDYEKGIQQVYIDAARHSAISSSEAHCLATNGTFIVGEDGQQEAARARVKAVRIR